MLHKIRSNLKRFVTPKLELNTPTGILNKSEHLTIYALLQVIADDEEFSPTVCKQYVDKRTSESKGYLTEYLNGIQLLKKKTDLLFPKKSFENLNLLERDKVLKNILWRYSYKENLPSWLRKFHKLINLSSSNKSIHFRQFVVLDLLKLYYTTTAGWSVVGYQHFPGKSPYDNTKGLIERVQLDHENIILMLSDGTFETIPPDMTLLKHDSKEFVWAKGGRQKAFFTTRALEEINSFLTHKKI